MKPNRPLVGPQRIDGLSVLYRLLLGGLGGVAGFLIIVLTLIVASSVLKNFLDDPTSSSPAAHFAILASMFITATVSNMLAMYLITLTAQLKYIRKAEGMMQILTVNVILFLFSIAAYFLTLHREETTFTILIIVLHLAFSALASVLVFEITATKWFYPLVTVYDAIIGSFIAVIILVVAYGSLTGTAREFTFVAIAPIILWASLGFLGGLTEYIYYQVYRRTGVDFLRGAEMTKEDPSLAEQIDAADYETESEV